MTDEISAQSTGTKKPRSRKKLVAMIATCGLILAGGITVVSVTAAKASAEETTKLCAFALDQGGSATKSAMQTTALADKALEAVKSTTLPKDSGTSAAYALRPAVEAAKDVPARASSADFISEVTKTQAALVEVTIPTECTDRVQASSIQTMTEQRSAAANALDTSVEALLADFTVFQTEETTRLAAEKAKAEADRIVAEQAADAERVATAAAAAEAEAAAAAAAQQLPQYIAPQPVGGGYVPAPAPYVPAPAPYVPAPAPAGGGNQGGGRVPGGGGGVGSGGGNNGACWTSNGMGGTKPC